MTTKTKLPDHRIRFRVLVEKAFQNIVREGEPVPYMTHCDAVADMIKEHGEDEVMQDTALGHDLFEDTEWTFDTLLLKLKEFGYEAIHATRICHGIQHLTDVYTRKNYPNWPRKGRKEREAIRLAKCGAPTHTIKYADIAHNCSTLSNHSPEFVGIYLKEKANALIKMEKGNQYLRQEAWDALLTTATEFNIDIPWGL